MSLIKVSLISYLFTKYFIRFPPSHSALVLPKDKSPNIMLPPSRKSTFHMKKYPLLEIIAPFQAWVHFKIMKPTLRQGSTLQTLGEKVHFRRTMTFSPLKSALWTNKDLLCLKNSTLRAWSHFRTMNTLLYYGFTSSTRRNVPSLSTWRTHEAWSSIFLLDCMAYLWRMKLNSSLRVHGAKIMNDALEHMVKSWSTMLHASL